MRAHYARLQIFERAQILDDIAPGIVEEQLAILGAADRDNPFEFIAILEQIVDGLSNAAPGIIVIFGRGGFSFSCLGIALLTLCRAGK